MSGSIWAGPVDLATTGGTKNPVAEVLVIAFIVIVGIVVLASIWRQRGRGN